MPPMRPIRPQRSGGRPSNLVSITDRPGPPAELIFGDWYPAAHVATLRPAATVLATLLGVPLLLGRKRDGSLFALRDLCPHRGIPLSAGWFDGETVQCKYHGWRFEPCSGRCEEIPSLTSHDGLEPSRIFANAFPVREADGYAWVYLPPPGAGRVFDESTLPPLPELPKFTNRFRTAHLAADLPCNMNFPLLTEAPIRTTRHPTSQFPNSDRTKSAKQLNPHKNVHSPFEYETMLNS